MMKRSVINIFYVCAAPIQARIKWYTDPSHYISKKMPSRNTEYGAHNWF